jgi:hypothetical protein
VHADFLPDPFPEVEPMAADVFEPAVRPSRLQGTRLTAALIRHIRSAVTTLIQPSRYTAPGLKVDRVGVTWNTSMDVESTTKRLRFAIEETK